MPPNSYKLLNLKKHKPGIHNIQCWKNSAVGLTGLLLGDLALLDEALHGQARYDQQMAKGVSADGPWFEGAWGYHFYTLNAVLHLAEGAYHSGIDLYGPELKRMFDAPLAMAMPDLSLPAFNDSQPVKLRFDIDGGKTGWWALAGGEPTTLITGTGVGRHTEDRVPLVVARREGKAAAYIWCIYLGSGGDGLNLQSEEVKLPDGNRPQPGTAVGARVKTASETQILLTNPSGRPVRIGGQQVEGKIVLLTPRDSGLLHVVYAAR